MISSDKNKSNIKAAILIVLDNGKYLKIQDSNTFINQNYTISTWIDTLALVMINCQILSMSPSFNNWYGDPY